MSKCEITITTEHRHTSFKGGERVKGHVTVVVNKTCTCRGLELRLATSTHGRGNRCYLVDSKQELFEGEWQSGQHHTYPFEVTLPDGPPTYHGEYINVVWTLEASADIPWAIDPSDELEIEVTPGPHGYCAEEQNPHAMPVPTWLTTLIMVLFTVLFACMPILPAVMTIIDLIKSESSSLLPMLGMMAAFACIWYGALLLITLNNNTLKRPLAARMVGHVRIREEQLVVHPGDTRAVVVVMTPRRLSGVRKVTATLLGQEIIVRGSGTDRRTEYNTVHREMVRLTDPPELRVGYDVEYTGEITIPKTAHPTFYLPSNQLRWSIEIEIDISRWFDWGQEQIVTVRTPATEQDPA